MDEKSFSILITDKSWSDGGYCSRPKQNTCITMENIRKPTNAY